MSDNTASLRIGALDALRGFLILGMVLVHGTMDLAHGGWIPRSIPESIPFQMVIYGGAGLFILLSGVTAGKSASPARNLRRGGLLALAAALVTAASYLAVPEAPVWFGILHLLAVSRLLYAGLCRLLPGMMRKKAVPVLCAALLTLGIVLCRIPTEGNLLLPLGFYDHRLPMTDYFPLLQWFPVFLFGTWLGEPVFSGRFPEAFYRFRQPKLEWVGRNSLWIYLLHQPVLLLLLGFLDMVCQTIS